VFRYILAKASAKLLERTLLQHFPTCPCPVPPGFSPITRVVFRRVAFRHRWPRHGYHTYFPLGPGSPFPVFAGFISWSPSCFPSCVHRRLSPSCFWCLSASPSPPVVPTWPSYYRRGTSARALHRFRALHSATRPRSCPPSRPAAPFAWRPPTRRATLRGHRPPSPGPRYAPRLLSSAQPHSTSTIPRVLPDGIRLSRHGCHSSPHCPRSLEISTIAPATGPHLMPGHLHP